MPSRLKTSQRAARNQALLALERIGGAASNVSTLEAIEATTISGGVAAFVARELELPPFVTMMGIQALISICFINKIVRSQTSAHSDSSKRSAYIVPLESVA